MWLPKVKAQTKDGLLQFAFKFTASGVYGSAVTLLLALYMAYGKPGSPGHDALRLIGMGKQYLPFFMLAYSVSRMILPDVSRISRPDSLLLPAVEGVGAVLCMMALLWLRLEFSDPYIDTAWTIAKLILSVVGARLFVRRVFRF